MKYSLIYPALLMLVIAFSGSNANADLDLVSGRNGNVYYITGGIGEEEQNYLESIQHKFNVRVTSSDSFGAYIGDTHVQVRDGFGQLIIESDAGPLFYIYLPDGKYEIDTTIEGKTKKKKIKAADGKTKLVHFSW